jgi:hypothetical protein
MFSIILYVDPGSGSLIFQAVLSGILSIIIFFKKIVNYVRYKFGKKDN